jgi:hypothetical protein
MSSSPHSARADAMTLDAPICIVGAGMSGILAAEKLHSLGYRHIDILEARSHLGGYCETIEIDGKVYDFQAHLIAQQDFGNDMAGTALQELLDKYPMETRPESLHFVSRSRSGKVRMSMPPKFVPLFKSMQPDQVIDQLIQAWTLIERAVRDRTGPGMKGLTFDRIAGETWETFRARHAPLVGEVLQSMTLYANMRRALQPAETVININAHLSGQVSQLAKAVLSAYPDHRERMLARIPASLIAQMSSDRPISASFSTGFNSFLQRIVRDCRLEIMLDAMVVGIEALQPGSIEVTFLRGAGDDREKLSKTYERLLVSTRPMQTRQIMAGEDIRELFSDQSCPPTWTRSYLIKPHGEVIPFPKSAGAGESLGFWLIDPYASYTDSDVEQSLHCITAANKQHESPYWICFSNSDRSISDEQAWSIARNSLFLFKDPELIAERISNWPVYPSAAALRHGWFDKLDAVQGRNGIFVIGEVICGPTIEAISTYIRDVIPRWFGGPDHGHDPA